MRVWQAPPQFGSCLTSLPRVLWFPASEDETAVLAASCPRLAAASAAVIGNKRLLEDRLCCLPVYFVFSFCPDIDQAT